MIFLNGPPRCGKDEAGRGIVKQFPLSRTYKMSRPLKEGLRAFLNLSDSNMRFMEEHKELEIAWCNDMSWREMQISMSEDWSKRVFGKAMFGHLATRFLHEATACTMTVITDSGFREEAEPVVKLVGGKNCLLIRLTREGCDFSNDSRSWITLSDLGVTEIDISNHYPEVEYYHTKLRQVLDKWLAPQQR